MLKRGFTLVEIIVVLVIVGLGIVLFYSLLFVNWFSFDNELTRVELHQQADEIFTQLNQDVFEAGTFNVLPGNQTVNITYPAFLAKSDIAYIITPAGEFQRVEGAATRILSGDLDPARSYFGEGSGSLIVNITLTQKSLGKRVDFYSYKQLLPRN